MCNASYYERISTEIDYVRGILCDVYDNRIEIGFDEYQSALNKILRHAESRVATAVTEWEKRRWTDVVIIETKSLLESSFDDYHLIDYDDEDEDVMAYCGCEV